MVDLYNINDHMARACACGCVRFNLLRSGDIECDDCQLKQENLIWSEDMNPNYKPEIEEAFTADQIEQGKATPEFIKRMAGQDYIESTRKYLDYLEDHLNNVAKAFNELSEACDGKEHWVGDDYAWWTFKAEVERHDLSKFSKEEFVQYRDNFFPVCEDDKENSCFDQAWEHHKKNNHHHHETAEHCMDIVHMVIDWMAMSYKFGGNPRDFYNKTKTVMVLDEKFHQYIDTLFNYLDEYRARSAV